MPKTLPTLQKGKQWFGFLKIPEGRVGKFSIRHQHYPQGKLFCTVTARVAVFTEQRAINVIATEDVVVHELCEGSGTWMTDLPIEQFQIDPLLAPMRGRVLIGGLGLGYAAQVLTCKSSVREVVVIEKSPEVIELVAKHIRKTGKRKLRVIAADLHEWLVSNPSERFDWAFYDIWAPDGEGTFHDHVLPLRRKTAEICDPEHVRCWNEDVMRGQILTHGISMLHMLLFPGFESALSMEKCCEPIGGKWHRTHDMLVPFFRAMRDGHVSRELQPARLALADFVRDYGIPSRKVWS